MLQYVLCHNTNTLRCHHNLFTIDVPNHLVCDFFLHIHRFNIINTEWKNILIVDCIHNRITMKLISKGLACGKELWILSSSCIDRKNRCSCKSKQVIFLEILNNSCMHISELTAVALIKNSDDVLTIHFMPWILFYKSSQFLNGSNDNMGIWIFQLSL